MSFADRWICLDFLKKRLIHVVDKMTEALIVPDDPVADLHLAINVRYGQDTSWGLKQISMFGGNFHVPVRKLTKIFSERKDCVLLFPGGQRLLIHFTQGRNCFDVRPGVT